MQAGAVENTRDLWNMIFNQFIPTHHLSDHG